jgi:hypothetical protein
LVAVTSVLGFGIPIPSIQIDLSDGVGAANEELNIPTKKNAIKKKIDKI